jgi:hypothetical protein
MAVKTIVIVEHAHCGSTMLAGLLEIAGIPMVGDDYKEMKWEDQEIVEAMRSGNEDAFVDVIKRRNAQHDVWGFKSPGAWLHMPLLLKHLRNPIFLAIYKDPVSVTMRRAGGRGGDFLELVENTVHQYSQSLRGMHDTRQFIYLFSYLKAMIDPVGFVRELSDVTQIEVDEETMARLVAFIQPNTGHSLTPYPSVRKALLYAGEKP